MFKIAGVVELLDNRKLTFYSLLFKFLFAKGKGAMFGPSYKIFEFLGFTCYNEG